MLSALWGQTVVRAADYQEKAVGCLAQFVVTGQEPGRAVLVAPWAMEFQGRVVALESATGLARAEEYPVQSVDQVVWVVQVEMVPEVVKGLE